MISGIEALAAIPLLIILLLILSLLLVGVPFLIASPIIIARLVCNLIKEKRLYLWETIREIVF